MKTMIAGTSLMAKDHGHYLGSVSDALDVVGSGLPGCIFTEADVRHDFFNLRNGIAGEIFQKFVNYKMRVAFIVPVEHGYGDRVVELIREHKGHPSVRFLESIEVARSWLRWAIHLTSKGSGRQKAAIAALDVQSGKQ